MTQDSYNTIRLALQAAIMELEYRLQTESIAPHLIDKNKQRLEDLRTALYEFENDTETN